MDYYRGGIILLNSSESCMKGVLWKEKLFQYAQFVELCSWSIRIYHVGPAIMGFPPTRVHVRAVYELE